MSNVVPCFICFADAVLVSHPQHSQHRIDGRHARLNQRQLQHAYAPKICQLRLIAIFTPDAFGGRLFPHAPAPAPSSGALGLVMASVNISVDSTTTPAAPHATDACMIGSPATRITDASTRAGGAADGESDGAATSTDFDLDGSECDSSDGAADTRGALPTAWVPRRFAWGSTQAGAACGGQTFSFGRPKMLDDSLKENVVRSNGSRPWAQRRLPTHANPGVGPIASPRTNPRAQPVRDAPHVHADPLPRRLFRDALTNADARNGVITIRCPCNSFLARSKLEYVCSACACV